MQQEKLMYQSSKIPFIPKGGRFCEDDFSKLIEKVFNIW